MQKFLFDARYCLGIGPRRNILPEQNEGRLGYQLCQDPSNDGFYLSFLS